MALHCMRGMGYQAFPLWAVSHDDKHTDHSCHGFVCIRSGLCQQKAGAASRSRHAGPTRQGGQSLAHNT